MKVHSEQPSPKRHEIGDSCLGCVGGGCWSREVKAKCTRPHSEMTRMFSNWVVMVDSYLNILENAELYGELYGIWILSPFFPFPPVFLLCDATRPPSLVGAWDCRQRARKLGSPRTLHWQCLTPCPAASGDPSVQSGSLHSLSLLQFCNWWCSWDYKPPVELASMQEEEHGSEPKDQRLPHVKEKCAGMKNSVGVRNRAPRSVKKPLGWQWIRHISQVSNLLFRLKLITSTFFPFPLNLRDDAGSYITTPCQCSPISVKGYLRTALPTELFLSSDLHYTLSAELTGLLFSSNLQDQSRDLCAWRLEKSKSSESYETMIGN